MKIKIREMVRKQGTTLYKLSKHLEMPPQTIYSWAGGRTQPSFKNMDKLCEVLNCDMNDLFEAEKAQFMKEGDAA
jgi:DNA-binding Xre family transcriptional regulator